ncbi:hypothetical protein K438DRAFT_2037038 [Mycena galopus ATCC 62051]|nr:hypothetical protein K438DRAFT_2037038 [Mycena galopus ATCC 62051]
MTMTMKCRRLPPRLKIALWFCALFVLVVLWVLMPRHGPYKSWATVPAEHLALAAELGHPAFTDIKIYEQNLSQLQALSRFSAAAERPRWNNVFQEQLLNTHLAYLSERAHVFPQYIPRDHPPFPDTLPNGTRFMLNVPMNAFVSGPTGGGPLSSDGKDSLTRRAIPAEGDGQEIMSKWAEKLLAMKAPFIGSDRVLSLWPSYGHSPTLEHFAWSPLITAALFRNFNLFGPKDDVPNYLVPSGNSPYNFQSFRPLHNSEPPITGTLGVHVRRGDYDGHCVNLANGGAAYNAWNALGTPSIGNKTPSAYPALPDYLDVPEGKSYRDAAFDHCWPSPATIVRRTHQIRAYAALGQNLRRIYISTNGDSSWVGELTALLEADGWQASSSLDMKLTLEERAVGQAVDMAVLTSAEMFIGVGFSSLTSNVVQVRLAGGRHPSTIHFW